MGTVAIFQELVKIEFRYDSFDWTTRDESRTKQRVFQLPTRWRHSIDQLEKKSDRPFPGSPTLDVLIFLDYESESRRLRLPAF